MVQRISLSGRQFLSYVSAFTRINSEGALICLPVGIAYGDIRAPGAQASNV